MQMKCNCDWLLGWRWLRYAAQVGTWWAHLEWLSRFCDPGGKVIMGVRSDNGELDAVICTTSIGQKQVDREDKSAGRRGGQYPYR